MPKTLKALTAEQQTDLLLFGLETVPHILETLTSGDRVALYHSRVSEGTKPLERYVAALEERGVDIGKGNRQYGWEMPLPENGESYRQLIVFKRR